MNDNPAKLRSLAAKSSCIQLVYEWAASWKTPAIDNGINGKSYGTWSDQNWFIWQMNEMQIPGKPVMPNSVRDQIEYYLPSILNQVTQWIREHQRLNFFQDEPASPLNEYLLKLIWRPDRSIDYAATAKNVSAGSNFNPMEKYRFACTHCFPEDVQNLSDMAKIAMNWRFEAEPLLVYWSKHLTNQLHTINVPVNAPIEFVMFDISAIKYRFWPAIEYFLAKLNTGVKIRLCGDIIKIEGGLLHRKEAILALLNEREKDTVYRDNMINLAKNYEAVGNFEGIRRIYAQLKGKLNSTNFALLIEELAVLSMKNFRNFNALTPLLMEIWNDACGVADWSTIVIVLQSRIAEKCVDLVDESAKFNFSSRDRYHQPLEFFRVLASSYEPRNFLKMNFYWLAIWQPFDSVVELIDEFQFGTEYVEELRTEARKSIDFATLLFLEGGQFDEMNRFVLFCYSDRNSDRISYLRFILTVEDGVTAVADALDHIDWRRVHEFVNSVYDDDVELRETTNYLLILNAVVRELPFFEQMMQRDEADSVIDCVETFASNRQDHLAIVKSAFIDLLHEYLDDHQDFVFKSATFTEVLIWACDGSEADVAQFKENVDIVKTFMTQLKSCVDEYTFSATDSMDEFLRWYYPVESDRKAFKLEMINSHGECGIIGEWLKQRRYRRHMLRWFFEKDTDEMM
ncbi:uncharacterized protein LOC135837932 [Planococcus citri]|uniref:uncharacterized protein LOC135837932 n=1 Tax=Planococcus citri TaxID=170843 RepID=UPI0031F84572